MHPKLENLNVCPQGGRGLLSDTLAALVSSSVRGEFCAARRGAIFKIGKPTCAPYESAAEPISLFSSLSYCTPTTMEMGRHIYAFATAVE
jgi:hypothetical protein